MLFTYILVSVALAFYTLFHWGSMRFFDIVVVIAFVMFAAQGIVDSLSINNMYIPARTMKFNSHYFSEKDIAELGKHVDKVVVDMNKVRKKRGDML